MILRARFVLTPDYDPALDGEVLVRDGIIQAIGKNISDTHPEEPISDFGNAAIIPGLINAHTHLDYTILRGRADDDAFFPWLTRMGRVAKAMDYERFLISCRLGLLQLVRSGVTTVADSTYSGAAVEAISEAGIRGIVCQEIFGPDPAGDYSMEVDALWGRVEELRANACDRVQVGVSPHSVYTASAGLLKLVAGLARDERLPLAVHVAETEAEISYIKYGKGVIAESHRARGFEPSARGVGPVEYLRDLGVLSPRTIAAHAVHVTDDDLNILRDERVGVAHCPISNAKLAAGIAPLRDMIRRGVSTGIGTDGAASSNSLDMFEEMKFAVLLQRAGRLDAEVMDARAVFDLATLGGARALGIEDKTGSIEVGKRADIAVVDLTNAAAFPAVDPYSAVVYSSSAADVLMTMVDGETLYRAGSYARVDPDEIRRGADIAAASV